MNNCKNIPNLEGKVAIVTGSNSGTGYGITFHLARHGCKVIMAARNEGKLTEARDSMLKEVPEADLEIEILDLMNLQSIKDFCARIAERYQKIDFLANNAGGGGHQYVKTPDGFEANFFLNYFGHFALTTQLLPLLKDGSRIVNFASIGYKRFLKDDLDVNQLECTDEKSYNQMQEYCRAKLCSILHSVKLSQEFERAGSSSIALACHPGNARTNLMYADDISPAVKYGFKFVAAPLMALFGMSHSLYDGALPAVEALIADDAKPGVVYAPEKKGEFTGDPIAWEIDRTHFQEEDIDKLWEKTQETLNIKVSAYL